MDNRKFSLIIQDFSQLVTGTPITINDNEALTLQYRNYKCIIDNGKKINLNNQIVILIKLDMPSINEQKALDFNFNFSLTSNGYIAIKDNNFYFIKHFAEISNPQELVKLLDESTSLVHNIKEELVKNADN